MSEEKVTLSLDLYNDGTIRDGYVTVGSAKENPNFDKMFEEYKQKNSGFGIFLMILLLPAIIGLLKVAAVFYWQGVQIIWNLV